MSWPYRPDRFETPGTLSVHKLMKPLVVSARRDRSGRDNATLNRNAISMDEDEVGALYDQLVKIVSSRRDDDELQGRDDYLTPILAEIEAGKAVQIKLKVPGEREIADPVAGRRTVSSSSADFIQRQDFSGREKLEILLRGIETSVIAPARMAVEINKSLEELDVEFDGTMHFGNDVANAPSRTVTSLTLLTTSMDASKLEALISEIRTELAQPHEATV